jgi:hypothetical protein
VAKEYLKAAGSGLLKAVEAIPQMGLPKTNMAHPIAQEMDRRVETAFRDRTYMPRAVQEGTKAVRANPKTAFVEDAVSVLAPVAGPPIRGIGAVSKMAKQAGQATPRPTVGRIGELLDDPVAMMADRARLAQKALLAEFRHNLPRTLVNAFKARKDLDAVEGVFRDALERTPTAQRF